MSIVTLAYETGRHRAVSFDVIGVYGDRIFLVDLCADWNGYAPVVDAALEVFQHCNTTYGISRIICTDAREQWVEIAPNTGAFDIFPYQDSVPIMVEFKCMMSRGANKRRRRHHGFSLKNRGTLSGPQRSIAFHLSRRSQAPLILPPSRSLTGSK